MMARFQIVIKSPDLKRNLVLFYGTEFGLGDLDLDRAFQISLPPRARDLLRIMMGIYVADRLVRRPRRQQETIGSREIELQVEVAHPDFWNDARTLRLLKEAIRRLSNDFWTFHFNPGLVIPQQLVLLPECPAVCQYSGGLDSAAGLCSRVRRDSSAVVTVTAAHQSLHGRLRAQLRQIGDRHRTRIRPVICRTRLANSPRLDKQETTQRLRGALFTALGGAVAMAVHADTIDVFENGVGAINLAPQLGMSLGAMSTRGCQPAFLFAMGQLVSHVAGRAIAFQLPMLRQTKREAVLGMVNDGLEDAAHLTMSCVHWPLRTAGSAKHCGTCFGCIGRRQALLAAKAADPGGNYEVDLFGSHSPQLYWGPRLLPLRASLLQVVDLRVLCESGRAPYGFHQHLLDAEVARYGMTVDDIIKLYRRYVAEWQPLIADAKARGIPWGKWVKRAGIAA